MTPHRVDVHHHILPPQWIAAIGEKVIGTQSFHGRTPQWSPAQSIEVMDRNGIATSITSVSAPGFWLADRKAAQLLVRHCNDYAAVMKRDHSNRFGMFAAVPLPEVDASLAEISYALDTLKADGIGLLTNYDGKYPGHADFAPVFDELQRRKAVVYFHPTTATCSQCLPEMPPATLEFPFDTTRAITSLLYSGTFARCPDIRFIFSHAGGAVPFLAARIARPAVMPAFKQHVPNGVIQEFQRLFYDTAITTSKFALNALLTLVTPANVVFGSDYPFGPEATTAASIKDLAEYGFKPEDLAAIERENALKLFPQFA